jgi:tripartite-type tricarboxylate transporter receptor subunit TctC
MRSLYPLALALDASSTFAQVWPSKPIRWIVPFPPSGSTDIATRTIAKRLTQTLRQAVVVENRAGATGAIGVEFVAKSPSDGYTVLSGSDSMTSVPHLHSKLGFDALKDFTPVIQLTRQPVVLAAHPSLGADSVAELVRLVKTKPGLAYASSGSGSPQNMYRYGAVC